MATQGENEEQTAGTFFEQSGGNAYVMLYRIDDGSKKPVYHGRLAVEEATEEHVSRLFGGGKYRAQLKEDNGTGKYVITQTFSFDLPGMYKPPTGELPGVQQATARTVSAGGVEIGAFGPSSSGTNPNEVLNTALVSQVIELMKASREAVARPSMLQEVLPLLTAFAPLIEKLVSREREEVHPLELMKQLAATMKDMMPPPPPPPPPQSPVSEVIGSIRELLDVKDMISGGGGAGEKEADPMMAGLAMAMKYLAEAKSNSGAAPTQPQLPKPVADLSQLPLWKQVLIRQKVQLLRSASLNIDPEFAAEIAIAYMPPNIIGVVNEFLAMPNHVQLAMETVPELQNFPKWTAEFFVAAQKQIAGDGEGDGDGELGGEELNDEHP